MTGDRRTTVDDGELERRLRLTFRTVMPLLDVEPMTGTQDDADGAALITIDSIRHGRPPRSRAKVLAIAAVVVVVIGVAVVVALRAAMNLGSDDRAAPAHHIAYTRTAAVSRPPAVIADLTALTPEKRPTPRMVLSTAGRNCHLTAPRSCSTGSTRLGRQHRHPRGGIRRHRRPLRRSRLSQLLRARHPPVMDP